jgi:hypothetical protein
MGLSDLAVRWILFIINPFIAMLFSFRDYMQPYSKNIFWAFCSFYGFTFAISKESGGSDINRYVDDLKFLYDQDHLTISDMINNFRLSGEVDILATIISNLLSRFTNQQAILTLVYAFIFGYFFSRNIWYVLNLLKGKVSLLSKIFILGLILVIPIWSINGFRMWTAFHVFIFGLLPFIFENKKANFKFIAFSFLVHYSFIIPISLVILYGFLGNRIKLYFITFIVSIFISSINIGLLNNYIDRILPQTMLERSEAYRNEDVIEQRIESNQSKNKVWYVKWNAKLLRWSFYLVLIYFYIYGNAHFTSFIWWKKLYSLSLIFFSVGNILSNIPSGTRYLTIPIFLTFIMIILYLDRQKYDYRFRTLMNTISPAVVLFIVVALRIGLYNTSITTVIGNPVIAIFSFENNLSLNDLIK